MHLYQRATELDKKDKSWFKKKQIFWQCKINNQTLDISRAALTFLHHLQRKMLIVYHAITQRAESACRCSMINLPGWWWVGSIQSFSALLRLRTALHADLLCKDAHTLYTEASVLPVYIAIRLCCWYLTLSPPPTPPHPLSPVVRTPPPHSL